nr:immunoglobulin light chain junction region [Macaca mulatta]MOW73431.1 immunoglobulin light chain junction region [Macaca mulatta]MOW74355.1 immunoglobulin light chain junction region [Macaca mulatta]MOW74462.1 immunoglobulin light chain junction region [Macaca mulatta]
CQQYTTSPYSF